MDKWRKLIYEANTYGMKKTEWCRINGISTKQFYYWQKRVRAQALEEMPAVVRGIKTAGTVPQLVCV